MGFASLQNGEIGEYICALRLLKLGISCRIVNMGATDIIADYNNKMWRIQVKSSALKGKKSIHDKNKSYQFAVSKGGKKTPFTTNDCDIIALVAIDREQIIFVPVNKLLNQTTKRMPKEKFSEHSGMHTWMDCMKYFSEKGL